MSSPVSYDLQGQGGGVVITSAFPTTGKFRWLQFITDTQLLTLESPNLANESELLIETIPAGTGIGGLFTEVSVTSGVLIAYYA